MGKWEKLVSPLVGLENYGRRQKHSSTVPEEVYGRFIRRCWETKIFYRIYHRIHFYCEEIMPAKFAVKGHKQGHLSVSPNIHWSTKFSNNIGVIFRHWKLVLLLSESPGSDSCPYIEKLETKCSFFFQDQKMPMGRRRRRRSRSPIWLKNHLTPLMACRRFIFAPSSPHPHFFFLVAFDRVRESGRAG